MLRGFLCELAKDRSLALASDANLGFDRMPPRETSGKTPRLNRFLAAAKAVFGAPASPPFRLTSR